MNTHISIKFLFMELEFLKVNFESAAPTQKLEIFSITENKLFHKLIKILSKFHIFVDEISV